ncbi:MAG: hypothetical protein ABI629_23110 [bacterium]
MANTTRSTWLTTCAILFALLAVSNLLKPLQVLGAQTGFVFFGHRLSGAANAIAGPLFGVYLAVYAFAIWTMRRFALPMSHAYAAYVILNLILFSFQDTTPSSAGHTIFGIVYMTIAIGVSLGAAIALTKRKAELA